MALKYCWWAAKKNSLPLHPFNFQQKRLPCFFSKGFAFYAEYNLRLFFFLLFCKANLFCAIDLDTILPCWLVSFLRNKIRIYDAHELFTEQKEIVTRPVIKKVWLGIESFAVPKFRNGYTVNHFIAAELKRRYGVEYNIIRNLPLWMPVINETYTASQSDMPVIIYQGAVNEGRSFETLVPAMQQVNARLLIYGEGNFFEQVKSLITQYNLQTKIVLKGYAEPALLKQITPTATIAVTLFEKTGLNQYYSLSNRFFDYIMAGVPQVCVNYPEYKSINDEYHIALMIDDTTEATIAAALNKLLNDRVIHNELRSNCLKARASLNWQQEEQKLVTFYKALQNG